MTAAAGRPWLVIPTYEERANLERVLLAACETLDRACPGGYRVLVVDDGSPDGTGALADRLAAADRDHVLVLHRARPEGLGPAYLAGFDVALRGGASHVLEMDADGSHDPADLARLLAADADVVLGSRYVAGGATRNWGLGRRVLSRGGSRYSRLMLGLPVDDLTGGFKCFRAEVLRAIDLPTVRSRGYAFQVELTWRAARAGFSVAEVPIVFTERTAGESKMSWRIALEAVWLIPRLRLGRRR